MRIIAHTIVEQSLRVASYALLVDVRDCYQKPARNLI